MKKLAAMLLSLGVILYSCTESEKPSQLALEDQVSTMNATGDIGKNVIQIPSQVPKGNSLNALVMASFNQIEDVSGDYTTETNLLDISEIPCNTTVNSVTDGVLTLDFDKTMLKLQADICGWYGTFGEFPEVESPNPHILYSNAQNSIGISLSIPVSTFGFELKSNLFGGPFEYQVQFYNEGNLIGTITEFVNAPVIGGGSLFAAETNASFDYVLIQAIDETIGFAIGQFRYAEGKNPFTVDVKPDSCENPVNLNSKGVIPVGILASIDLDVNDIDLSTVRLNGVAPKMSSISDLGGFYEKEESCDCNPTEFDGVMDLDLKFNTQEIVATLGEVEDGEHVTVSLSFETMDGKSWTGEDCIWVIKKPVLK